MTENEGMTQNEIVTACLRRAEFSKDLFNTRRSYEWKISLGLWAAILGSVTVFKGHSIPMIVGILIGVIVISVHTFLWLKPLWEKNKGDQGRAFHYVDEAVSVLIDPSHKVTEYEKKHYRFWEFLDWSVSFQITVTILLLVLAMIARAVA